MSDLFGERDWSVRWIDSFDYGAKGEITNLPLSFAYFTYCTFQEDGATDQSSYDLNISKYDELALNGATESIKNHAKTYADNARKCLSLKKTEQWPQIEYTNDMADLTDATLEELHADQLEEATTLDSCIGDMDPESSNSTDAQIMPLMFLVYNDMYLKNEL